MIISVEDARQYITTSETDAVLAAKLRAVEALIRKYTNNNFQQRNVRFKCSAIATKLFLTTELLSAGDTIQVSESLYNDGVYTVVSKEEEGFIELDKPLIDEANLLITKVVYPEDVKLGVVNMLKWDIENRDKVGIASETISRHSVTYFNMDGENSNLGYPKSLIGFLKPYMKARF